MQSPSIVANGPILFVGAHTDDLELGAGGTLSRALRTGSEVHCAAFSRCEASLPVDAPPDTLELEMSAACKSLGVPGENIRVFQWPVRYFPTNRQAILEQLIDLRLEIEPTLVVAPSSSDVHQDHQAMAYEAQRAFKGISLLAYELPWNSFKFHTECYVRLEDVDVSRKIEAIGHYASQSDKPYTQDEYLRSQLVMRGLQAGAQFAEAFDVIRWVI